MSIDWSQLNTSANKLAAATAGTKAAIASRRFDAETRGMTISGMSVYTDRTTQMKLTAASVRADRDPAYTVDWKLTNNTFVTLNAEQLIAIGDAVGDYVQACYTRESVLLTALAGGTYTDAMLQEGWPV
jgi:predicted transcriptional regulator